VRPCFGEDDYSLLGGRSCWYLPQWGECTSEHTSPWCEESRLYSCQTPLEPNEIGQGTSRGCEVGCANCYDYPVSSLINHFVPTNGRRFLAPSLSFPNRAADGLMHDLGREPMRIPRVARFKRAACWHNNGLEEFGTCQCDCWPGNSTLSDGVVCPDGTPVDGEVTGAYHDCYAYTDYDSPPQTECRHTNDHYEVPVELGAGRLFNAANHRTNGCLVNLMMLCAGAAPSSHCSGSFLNMGRTGAYYYDWLTGTIVEFPPYCPGTGTCFYMNPTTDGRGVRQFFNRLYIKGNTARLRNVNSDPVIDAKNAVLRHLAGRSEFDQIDFKGVDGDSSLIDYWSRSMSRVSGTPNLSMPAVWEYPLSHLRNAGCLIPATLRLRDASIQMSLYIVQKKGSPTNVQIPYVTIRIRAECVVTVPSTLCPLIRPWADDPTEIELRIDNEGNGHLPVVTPSLDDMVFVDAAGRISNPPVIVEWWGMLGAFSDPQTANIYDSHGEGIRNLGNVCQHLWDTIQQQNIVVGGWPYAPSSSGSPNQVYEGQLVLGF